MAITIYAGKTENDLVLKYPLREGGEEHYRYHPLGKNIRKSLIDHGRFLIYNQITLTANIRPFSDDNGCIENLLRSEIELLERGRRLGFPKLSRKQIEENISRINAEFLAVR